MAFQIYAGGRRPPHSDGTHPRAWINDALEAAPEHIPVKPAAVADWSSAIPADAWGMDLNDDLGDCGVAAADHWQMAVTARTGGSWRSWGNDVCLQVYESWGGYQPGNPATDQGTNLQDNLTAWRHTPIQGTELLGFAAIRPGTWVRPVRVAMMQMFGPLYTGINLQQAQEDQFPGPWTWIPGGAMAGGHATITAAEAAGTDEIEEISWGAGVRTNQQFFMDSTEECWVLFTEASVDAAGSNPYGFNLAQMNDMIATLTRERNPLRLRPIFATGGAVVSDQTIESGDQVEINKISAADLEPEAEGEASASQPLEPGPAGEAEAEAPETAPADPPAPNQAQLSHPGVSNAGPALPASAQAAAARAHQIFTQIIAVAQRVQTDLERYVPPELISAAEQEAKQFIRDIL